MNRQDVLDRALQTLDSYGFADLSMRRLAGSLGVQPGALYWHFANKQSLLLALAEVILEPVTRAGRGTGEAGTASGSGPVVGAPAGWEDGVRRWSLALHDALLAHRDGAELVASVLALRPRGLDPARSCAERLTRAGMPAADAQAAAAALVHYTVGHAVDAQNRAQARALGVRELNDDGDQAPDTADAAAQARFGFGLEIFLAGLRARLV